MGALEAVLDRKIRYSGNSAFEHGCNGKVPHPSEDGARTHAKELKKRMKKRFDVYRCRFCDSFHVGTHRRDHFSVNFRSA